MAIDKYKNIEKISLTEAINICRSKKSGSSKWTKVSLEFEFKQGIVKTETFLSLIRAVLLNIGLEGNIIMSVEDVQTNVKKNKSYEE